MSILPKGLRAVYLIFATEFAVYPSLNLTPVTEAHPTTAAQKDPGQSSLSTQKIGDWGSRLCIWRLQPLAAISSPAPAVSIVSSDPIYA